jgi:tetratricopeptide (TPR) repeat protein
VNRQVGDFEIVREVGRGGMGVVYEARQVSLNRQVALKVLSGGLGLTPKAVQRFRREAEAAARLHHTNIVSVYAIGQEQGTHFYAMELIQGPSLDHVIRQMRAGPPSNATPPAASGTRGSLSPDLVQTGPYVESPSTSGGAPGLTSSLVASGDGYFDTVARLVAEVADALDYAHGQGVIHRDIKPSNLLLSPAGRLSVNDFGLARLLEHPGVTVTGEFVGTPAYMSPEQVTAGRVPVDHRTDIYSLGATLYELLTLEPPHQGQSRERVLAQIVQKEPRPPRRLQKQVPVDLETICLKCLEKDPDRRYQTAKELADDLRRYANRFAISARRAGPVERLGKWVRRHPAAAGTLAVLVLALAAIGFFGYRADVAERQRLAERGQAEARLRGEQERARLQLLDEKVRNAYQVASSGDLKRTDEAIKEIEGLGASTGQVRLLRGMVAYFRGDSEAALGELEQAVQLLPGSVAALALLAMSCQDTAEYGRSDRMILELVRLTPSTPEDYLFKGYALEMHAISQGLGDLNEGLRRRDSPLGRALRALVLANRAQDTGRRQDVEEALADANLARGMLPSNLLALTASLYARTVAAGIYQEAGLKDQHRAVLEEAARDVQALGPVTEFGNVAWYVWLYHEITGQPSKAVEAARRALEKSGDPTAAFNCVVTLYRQGRFIEALACLDKRGKEELVGDALRAVVLAELPDGPGRAMQEYGRLTRKYPEETPVFYSQSFTVLMLLGRRMQAVALLERYRLPPGQRAAHWEAPEATRQFISGQVSEEKHLAKAGASRVLLSGAHFEVGLSHLAAGDRAGARWHFQKAVATRAYWSGTYFQSQMLLSRLEKDPGWPPWMPAKK